MRPPTTSSSIGSGPGFVKHVLDTTQGTSLGGDDRYKALADRAGKGSASASWTSRRSAASSRTLMAEEDPREYSDYEKNVQPYLEPFDALIVASSSRDDLTRQHHLIITVK